MATGVATEKQNTQPAPDLDATETFIKGQLAKTSAQVRAFDLSMSLIVLCTVLLGSLFILVLIDHWLWGLPTWMRIAGLAWIAGATAYAFWNQVLPSLTRRINPLYAAKTIEEGKPTLKNSLINFLLLRRQPDGIREVVFQAARERAAADLSNVKVQRSGGLVTSNSIGICAGGPVVCIRAVLRPFSEEFRGFCGPSDDALALDRSAVTCTNQ